MSTELLVQGCQCDYIDIDGIFYHSRAERGKVAKKWNSYLQSKPSLPMSSTCENPWRTFCNGKKLGTVLEYGSRTGELLEYLSRKKKLTCEHYYAFEIDPNRLLFMSTANSLLDNDNIGHIYPFADLPKELPVESSSVDLIISDSVFPFINKNSIFELFTEFGRVLKNGGAFVFGNSFLNGKCPANIIQKIFGSPGQAQYENLYFGEEIEQLIYTTGIAKKCGDFQIIGNDSFKIVPDQISTIDIKKLAGDIHCELLKSPRKGLAVEGFTVFSTNIVPRFEFK